MDFSQKRDFLYQSISDIQQTIRAIDVKIGFMFVVLLLPLPVLEDIYKCISHYKQSSPTFFIFTIATIIAWLLSFFFLMVSVIALSSPSSHVQGAENLKGTFYESNLYNLKSVDAFINFPIKSNLNISEILTNLPTSEETLLRELAFEKAKLAYIRDIKILRSSYCIYLVPVWLLGGITLWTVSKAISGN